MRRTVAVSDPDKGITRNELNLPNPVSTTNQTMDEYRTYKIFNPTVYHFLFVGFYVHNHALD